MIFAFFLKVITNNLGETTNNELFSLRFCSTINRLRIFCGHTLARIFSSLVAQKSLGLDFEAMAAGTPRGDVPQRGIMEDWGASNGGWRKTRPALPHHFVENGEADALKMARRDIMDELQKTIQKRMGKMGIVMG